MKTDVFFWGRRLFPKTKRDDVYKAYTFIQRVSVYAQAGQDGVKQFEYIERRWHTIKTELQKRRVPTPLDESADEHALANIAYVVHRYNCDPDWIDAFLFSMRWDIQQHTYRGLKDTLRYMFGAAEVPALILARITNLPEEALKMVRLQARAVQYLHFIRELSGSNVRYIPNTELKKYGLKSLNETEAHAKPTMFKECIHGQLLHYATWQAEASLDMYLVPKRYRVPLQAMVDICTEQAEAIKNDPFIVYGSSQSLHKRDVLKRVLKRTIMR